MGPLNRIDDETRSTPSSDSGPDPQLDSGAVPSPILLKRKADEDAESYSSTEPESDAEADETEIDSGSDSESESDSESDSESESENESDMGSDGEFELEVENGDETQMAPRWIFKRDPSDGKSIEVLCQEFEYKFPDDKLLDRPRRDLTEEEEEEYYRQVAESECFDVQLFPNINSFGLIQPTYFFGDELKSLVRYAKAAVNYANVKRKREGKNKLKLLGIVKAMSEACSPIKYYYTLKAQDVSTQEIKIYEAPVFRRFPEERTRFPFFREKGVRSEGLQYKCSYCY